MELVIRTIRRLGHRGGFVVVGAAQGPSLVIAALALTHAAGLMAISFFALWGTWDWSWWVVNVWLAVMPLILATMYIPKHAHWTDRN